VLYQARPASACDSLSTSVAGEIAQRQERRRIVDASRLADARRWCRSSSAGGLATAVLADRPAGQVTAAQPFVTGGAGR
jgi:hypothetical protein